MKTTELQFSNNKALIVEMKAVVDSFYSNLSNKISSIKKEHLREIIEQKAQLKYTMRAGKSANSCKKDSETGIIGSDLTRSSWASEKQHEKHKQILQLVSYSGSSAQDPQWSLLNAVSSHTGYSSKYPEVQACRSQTLSNSVISADDVKYGYSSC